MSSVTEENIVVDTVHPEARLLPETFEPCDRDVVVGWARQNQEHPGNRMFQRFIESKAAEYLQATTKTDKTIVIAAIVDFMRNQTQHGGGFVKKNTSNGRWYEIGDNKARDKVGSAIRKAAYRLEKHLKKQTKYNDNKNKKNNENKEKVPSSFSFPQLALRAPKAKTSPSPCNEKKNNKQTLEQQQHHGDMTKILRPVGPSALSSSCSPSLTPRTNRKNDMFPSSFTTSALSPSCTNNSSAPALSHSFAPAQVVKSVIATSAGTKLAQHHQQQQEQHRNISSAANLIDNLSSIQHLLPAELQSAQQSELQRIGLLSQLGAVGQVVPQHQQHQKSLLSSMLPPPQSSLEFLLQKKVQRDLLLQRQLLLSSSRIPTAGAASNHAALSLPGLSAYVNGGNSSNLLPLLRRSAGLAQQSNNGPAMRMLREIGMRPAIEHSK